MLTVFDVLAKQGQSFMKGLFLKYKLGRALLFSYIFVETLTLLLTSIAYLTLGVQGLHAFFAFIGLSAAYTFFFFLSFSYFLYNVLRWEAGSKRRGF